jgi:hypothetical protein
VPVSVDRDVRSAVVVDWRRHSNAESVATASSPALNTRSAAARRRLSFGLPDGVPPKVPPLVHSRAAAAYGCNLRNPKRGSKLSCSIPE